MLLVYLDGAHSVVASRTECSFKDCRMHAPHAETREERQARERRQQEVEEFADVLAGVELDKQKGR